MSDKKNSPGGKRKGAGRKPVENPKKNCTFRATEDQMQAFDDAAERDGLKRSAWLLMLASNFAKSGVSLKDLTWQAQQEGKELASLIRERLGGE